MTLIEVLMSALMVVLLAAGVALGLISSAQTTADQRHRSQASELAQQDQERLKGLSALQLTALDTPQSRSVTLDGVPYTITSSAQFLNSTGGSACGSTGAGAAAYYEVYSKVNWASNLRPAVQVQSLITPPAGGTLLTQVKDQTGSPLSGVGVAATGADSASGTTDSNGCAIFSGLDPGDYTLTLTAAGYVDPNDNPSPITQSATVTGTGTATPSSGNPLILGLAGSISANFTSNSGALTGQKADALSWYGAGSSNSMAIYKSRTYGAAGVAGSPIPSSGSITLFPFAFTGPSYTNNYAVWAGPCRQQEPPTGVDDYTVGPGSNQAINVQEPALDVFVKQGSSQIAPSHVRITFTSANNSGPTCTDTWSAAIAANAATSPTGALAFPGQPFATTATSGSSASASGYTGTIVVCADNGSRFIKSSSITNSNFSSPTSVTITIPNSGNSGTCP